jgi:hypothetical protein
MMARDDIKWYMDRRARKRAARNLWEHQQKVLKNQLQWRAADATQAMQDTGIHRLALLGISPADAGPSIPVGQFMGDSGAGDSIVRGMMAAPSKEEQNAVKADVAIKGEQKKALELENEKTRLEIAKMKSTGWNAPTGDPVLDWLNNAGAANAGNGTNFNTGDGTGGNSPVVVKQKEQVVQGALGLEAGMEAFEKLKQDMDGFVYVVPADSQDIEENAFIKAIYYSRKAKQWGWPKIDKVKSILEKVKPPPAGYRYVFRRASGQFQMISDEQFFKEHAGEWDTAERRRKGHKVERRKGQARRIGRRVGSYTPY